MRTVLVSALLLMPCGLPAQRVFGRVLDASTSKPVQNVEVRLISADGPVGRVVTDTAGRFVLRSNLPGNYKIDTNHIAYAPVSASIELSAELQVEVVLRVSIAATELPPLEVIARSRA